MNLIKLLTALILSVFWLSSSAQSGSDYQSPIFNGREYLRPPFYIHSGIPYFKSDTLIKGTVVFDGFQFDNVPLIYDQISDDIITYDVTGSHLIRLVKDKVSAFSLHGARFLSLRGMDKNIDGYYQVTSGSNGSLLKKETKQIRTQVKGQELFREIVSKEKFVVLYKNAYVPVSSSVAAKYQDDSAWLTNLVSTSKNKHVVATAAKPIPKQATAQVEFVETKIEKSKQPEFIVGEIGSLREGKVSLLEDVVVIGQRVNNVKGRQLGIQTIDIKEIRQVPMVLGEADVLRVVTSLPGVKTVGEASTGLNVRGGSTDQNLILFNDATIYNPSHFFGMFSAFNPDVVKDIVLYKSSTPARYGGRLASVLEIGAREGNKKEISGSAGVGPLTSRLSIEGPIFNEKTSFLFGGRATYANWLMKLLPDEYENSRAGFYDVNLFINHKLDKRNTIDFTGYLSADRFKLNSDTLFGYQNKNLSIKWSHIFSNKLNATLTSGIDNYQYSISSERNPVNAYRLKFNILQYNLKAHFNYYVNADHTIDFGISSIRYLLDPGSYKPNGSESLVESRVMNREHGLESAIYVNDKWDVNSTLSLEAGIRYSVYSSLGPRDINMYPVGVPKDENNVIETKSFSAGKFIKTYGGPEYRVSVRQMLGIYSSIKAGFTTQRQYIHMLSNTAAMAPTDIWKLSDPNIRPQQGSQVSLGIYRNFKSNIIEVSVEGYYKKITNYLDYKSGANLVLNNYIEADVINTNGKAYGVEFLLKKTAGKLNGWIGYTWSRILLKQDDSLAGEIINEGEYYPANYDKPHDFSFIGNYKINHRFSISFSATYSTGRPITLPIGRYYYAGSYRTVYDKRNEHRIPDYFRSDFSLNIDGNHKKGQKTHNSWTLGVYNMTGRKNPYSVFYLSENGVINGYKLSIFGSAIPFLSFNIRF